MITGCRHLYLMQASLPVWAGGLGIRGVEALAP